MMNWLRERGVKLKQLYCYESPYIPESVYQNLESSCFPFAYRAKDRLPAFPKYPTDGALEWTLSTKNGSLFKRLSKWYYEKYHYEFSEDVRRHLSDAISRLNVTDKIYFEFNQDLFRPARYFFHTSSCWWKSAEVSRQIVYQLDGVAVRLFREENKKHLTGRCFLLPYGDGFIVINGYDNRRGNNATETFAQILSSYFKANYTSVEVSCNQPIYINRSKGYYVYDAPKTSRRSVRLNTTNPNDGALINVLNKGGKFYVQQDWKTFLNREEKYVKATYHSRTTAYIKIMFRDETNAHLKNAVDLYAANTRSYVYMEYLCSQTGLQRFSFLRAERIVKLIYGRAGCPSKNMQGVPHAQT